MASEFQILGASTGSCATGPWARLVGRRADRTSVALTIHGLLPFFYVKLADGFLVNGAPNEPLLETFHKDLNRHLNTRVHRDQKHTYDFSNGTFTLLKHIEVVQRYDFYGYSPNKHYYAKLTFTSLGAHREARWALSSIAGTKERKPSLRTDTLERIFPHRKKDIQDIMYGRRGALRKGIAVVLAEANIDFHDQVMDILGLKPGGWCALGEGVVHVTRHDVASRKEDVVSATACYQTHRDLKGSALAAAVKPADVARAAPVRVLAWDLEVFCEPLGDGAMKFYNGDDTGAKLLCVSAVTFDYGVPDSTASVVFSLGEAPASQTVETATDGSPLTIRWFGNDEEGLMRAFFQHVHATDPDVVTGWNTLNFDWPWLWKRAEVLGLLPDLYLMGRWGMVRFDESDKARQVVEMPGRELHDMMVWTRKNRQLREYGLEFVATEYGLTGKDDVSYDQISTLFKTHEGRVKLAVYCEMDSRLVCQLMQKPQLDPLGKALAIAAITGVQPEHILHRGSMHTLRLAMLRASHASEFLLSCPARGKVEEAPLMDTEDDESRYQGGKVLNPITGFYRDPVVTLDFGSLYPSCMCELNICASTRLTRAEAKFSGLDYSQPPAPDLTGVWYRGTDKVCRIVEAADDNVSVYSFKTKKTVVARYTDQLNESITLPNGKVWLLEDGGYAMRVGPDELWHRADKDVLVMVDTSVREGVIPMLERTLKLDRKAAKKKLAQAEEAGDKATMIFMDNLQAGIKILMNALYGGLGTGKGGIFPESSPLASAITARGRSLIVMVKKTLEQRFWLLPDGSLGGFENEPAPSGGSPLRILYGDTDSVMIHFPGCTLQQSASHGELLSTFFDTKMLKQPQSLAFEKILFPCAFYKKKMYCALKWEGNYGADAKGKIFARGLSAVRRDNAKIVQDTVLKVMDLMFKQVAPRAEIVAFCGKAFANIHNSAVLAHEGPERDFTGRLPFASFIQSAGLSKAIDDYDAESSATAVAKQMLAANAQCGVGKHSRVTYVVSAQFKGAKRSDQALLPSICQQTRAPLDTVFYEEALMKKLAPLLCVLFMDEERASRRVRTLDGRVVEQEPASAAARARLLGEATAERALLASFREQKLMEASHNLRQASGGGELVGKKRKVQDAGQASIIRFFCKV